MYCSKCGNEIKEGNSFCTKCGSGKKKNTSHFNKSLIIVSLLLIIGASFFCFHFIKSFAGQKSITQNSYAQFQPTSSLTAFSQSFDYSNRFVAKKYTPINSQVTTGDPIIDQTQAMTDSIMNSANQTIVDSDNFIKKSISIHWGFRPDKINFQGNQAIVDGFLYNDNPYADVYGINNLKFFLLSVSGQPIAALDYSDNQFLSQVYIHHNEKVPARFVLKNIKVQSNSNKYVCVISSDFSYKYDEEKIRQEHPEAYNASQYYKQQAEFYKDKATGLQDEYLDMVNKFNTEHLIDAATY